MARGVKIGATATRAAIRPAAGSPQPGGPQTPHDIPLFSHTFLWSIPHSSAALSHHPPPPSTPPPPGLWLSRETVGDAGASHLGYYTAAWGPARAAVLAHGHSGALHLWRRAAGGADGSSGAAAASSGAWAPAPSCGGHVGAVADCAWAAGGRCLVSVSDDQTARCAGFLASERRWAELARPQVHGHAFSCVAAPPPAAPRRPGAPPRWLLASGSEEKVLRLFAAPRTFHDTLAFAAGRAPAPAAAAAGGAGGGGGEGDEEDFAASDDEDAYGAALPALGLSQKAVYEGDAAPGGADGAGAAPGGYAAELAPAAPRAVAGAPLEEHLAHSTLWPEVQKLYGHGAELSAAAADPTGAFLATAARAAAPADAGVWLWAAAARWAPAPGGPLAAHALTVAALAFSPDGRLLASAGRDRAVAVFVRRASGGGENDNEPPFALAAKADRAHARVVWGLDFSPGGALLASAGRDGRLKLWGAPAAGEFPISGAAPPPLAPLGGLALGEPVRAVAFAPTPLAATAGAAAYLAAVGLEGGAVVLLRVERAGGAATATEVWRAPAWERHAAAVRRVRWRPAPADAGEAAERGAEGGALLATCGDDHAVRLFSVAAEWASA